MNDSMKPVVLVDGSSYFFRAFHALPPLMNSKGQPTGAIYGVVNMVRRLLKDVAPTYVVIVFDTKGKTFRDELYPAYKAHRPPMPEELSSQFEPMIQLLKTMGLPVVMIEGVEADDVIGTLALEAQKQGESVLISTGDKDFAQLVNDRVTLLNTMTNQRLDIPGVQEKFGILPHQIIDYLALVGDSVDNVPGVPKCGPKTAVKWLMQYQTLDNLVAHADDITGKIGESLRASLSSLPLSKLLVTIKTDVELNIHMHDFRPGEPDLDGLLALLQDLEFKSWIKEVLEGRFSVGAHGATPAKQIPSTPAAARQSYAIIQDLATWKAYFAKLQQAPQFCLDTETTSLDPLDAQLVGLSLAIQAGEAVYVPFLHTEAAPQLSVSTVMADLKPLLEDKHRAKIGQNLKYDYSVLRNLEIAMQGMHYDTMLESYILNSSANRHDMETLALKYLGYHPLSYKTLTKKEGKVLRFDEVSIEEAGFYSAEDADVTLRLHEAIYPLLSEGQRSVLATIEMPLVPVLAEMERHGVLIDEQVLKTQGTALKARLLSLEEEAIQLVGRPFNIQSPLQLQTILFEEQKLPVVAKTPKGQPSTAESALQELAYTYRLPAVILEYRRLSKLVSTYIDALPKRIHPKTHRVHTSFNQAVAATGRLSSSEPNLQNIPIRSEEGRAIRRAFIAPAGQVLLSADYSQIELRIMAHLSQDARLIEAFGLGLDIHAATAAEIFGIALNEVHAEHRRRAKAVNFGLIYGMSAFGLAKQLGIDRAEADRYVTTYFERYPGVLDYMERTRTMAREKGYVETLFGRRLYLPEINAKNMMRRKAAERMAINAPMQGTAADLIKLAMLSLSTFPENQATMVLQVHDELVFEVHEPFLEEVKQVVKDKMEHVIQLDVPLLVSVGVGKNWEAAH